jgi:hypothetical protein
MRIGFTAIAVVLALVGQVEAQVDGEYSAVQEVDGYDGVDFQPGDTLLASFDWSFTNNDPNNAYTVTIEIAVYDADWNYLGTTGGGTCKVPAGQGNSGTFFLEYPVPESGYSTSYYFATEAYYEDQGGVQHVVGGGSVQFVTD